MRGLGWDDSLGGQDFDAIVFDMLADEFNKVHLKGKDDVRGSVPEPFLEASSSLPRALLEPSSSLARSVSDPPRCGMLTGAQVPEGGRQAA